METKELERRMQIFVDIKKTYLYSKNTGNWFWHDRDDPGSLSPDFPTFAAMLHDATNPYYDETEWGEF